MYSMTGFGRTEANTKLGKMIVEISSVNNRFLEYSIRLPRSYQALDPAIRELVGKHISRGKISVYIGLEEPQDNPARYTINKTAVAAYVSQLRKIGKEMKIPGDITIRDLVLIPDIVVAESSRIDLKTALPLFERQIEQTIKKLLQMRQREGKAMATDMKKRLKNMSSYTKTVKKSVTGAVKSHAQKLRERIEELLDSAKFDSNRMEEEIALLADRTDITEETVRLESHIAQFSDTINSKDSVGRRLNFILQEMNRESNTIGSKSGDYGVSSTVIALKEEIEKLREMVQNVE